jgi:hypothetical protein
MIAALFRGVFWTIGAALTICVFGWLMLEGLSL